ncbi:MAG: sugar ABC transporter ATP-binding protein, partial [Verrucomicrobia bacterium]|nr:sugar ABC transporter ATP-binding protein [Verrucomicrobiota bacterium]
VRHGIAYVSEDRLSLGLVMPQSIEDNTILTIMRQLVGRFQLINTRVKQRTVTDWIDQLKIKARSPAQPVRELSGGNQQRVVLAKWLATKPRILILDSPTVGVDVGAKSGIYEIIKGLARQGLAILFISDEVEEVWHETHRIMVMREGKIVATYKPGQVTEGQLQEIIHA